MRIPTSDEVRLAYWRDQLGHPISDRKALAHLDRRHWEEPEPGFYKLKIRRDGPFVPARVWLHQEIDPETGELTEDEHIRAEIDGRDAGFGYLEQRWTYFKAIAENEYLALMAARERGDAVGDMMRASQAKVDLAMKAIRP